MSDDRTNPNLIPDDDGCGNPVPEGTAEWVLPAPYHPPVAFDTDISGLIEPDEPDDDALRDDDGNILRDGDGNPITRGPETFDDALRSGNVLFPGGTWSMSEWLRSRHHHPVAAADNPADDPAADCPTCSRRPVPDRSDGYFRDVRPAAAERTGRVPIRPEMMSMSRTEFWRMMMSDYRIRVGTYDDYEQRRRDTEQSMTAAVAALADGGIGYSDITPRRNDIPAETDRPSRRDYRYQVPADTEQSGMTERQTGSAARMTGSRLRNIRRTLFRITSTDAFRRMTPNRVRRTAGMTLF